MKKITAVAIIVALIIILPSISLARQYDKPVGFVNDFANIIPDEKQKLIETKLSNHKDVTTNEIAVLTTPSLGGNSIEEFCIDHAQGWGIGQRGKDNGILICVAVQERKYRVEIGRGLEGAITDAKAGRLADGILKPAFRKGEYTGGLNELTDAIISEISKPGSVQESTQGKTQSSIAEKKANGALIYAILAVLFLGLLMFAGFVIYRGINLLITRRKEKERKKILRDEITSDLEKDNKVFSQFEQVVGKAKKDMMSYPAWAEKTAREKIESFRNIFQYYKREADSIKTMVEYDPDLAKVKMPNLKKFLSEGESEVSLLAQIPKGIAELEKKAPDKVAEAIADLGNLEVFAKTMADSGYQLEKIEFSKTAGAIETAISAVKQMLGSNSSGKDSKAFEICQAVDMAQKEIGNLRESLIQLEQTKKYVDEKIGSVQDALAALIQKKDSHENVLDPVMKENPEEVWLKEHEDFLRLPEIFKKAKWLIESAQKNVSMEEQNFGEARQQIDGAETMVVAISRVYENIVMKTKQIDESKNICSGIGNVESLVNKAKHAVSDSDVESDTKKLARDADTKLEESRTTTSAGGLINWLLAALLINESTKLAKNAIHKAQEDIDEAERRRRKKKKDEEAAAAARRRSSSSYSSSNYSSSSSSSGSFGGFSGGGGGSFGGGGASGGW